MDDSRRWVLPLLLVGIFAAMALLQLGLFDRAAPALALLAPIAVCWIALARALRRGASGTVATAVLFGCVAIAALVAVDYGVRRRDLAAVPLSFAAPHQQIDVGRGASEFDVYVDGTVGSVAGAQGDAAIELARGGQAREVEAAFSRASLTSRVGRRTTRGAGAAHDQERFRVTLASSGPIDANLKRLSGSIGNTVRLSVAPVPWGIRAVEAALLAAALVLVLHDALNRDRSRTGHLIVGVAAFSLCIERNYSPRDAASGLLMASAVAAAAALLALASSALMARWITRARVPKDQPRPASRS